MVFGKTRIGISLRGVADDTLAAQSIGIRLPTIWRVVWSVSGVVALVAGLLWGARQGVQFSLTMVVLKAMPVLIIGGFSSITGAIVGGLLVGASESLADIYLGPLLAGGAVSNWFAYMLAVGFLLVRPSGLFGDRRLRGCETMSATTLTATEPRARTVAPLRAPVASRRRRAVAGFCR